MCCERRSPPCGLAATAPSCAKFPCQRTALAALTPKRWAACRREEPSATARTTRSRRSDDNGDGIRCSCQTTTGNQIKTQTETPPDSAWSATALAQRDRYTHPAENQQLANWVKLLSAPEL